METPISSDKQEDRSNSLAEPLDGEVMQNEQGSDASCKPEESLNTEAVTAKASSVDDQGESFGARFEAAMQSSVAQIADMLVGIGLMSPPEGAAEGGARAPCGGGGAGQLSADERAAVLPGGCSLQEVAKGIAAGRFKRIVVMAGAGISVAAGIPDFRTPGTGLYDNLQKYNLPTPQSVFDLAFFTSQEPGEGPSAFYSLARELWPGQYKPTLTHHFIQLLHEKGLLLRCFTQNIDGLERLTGLPAEALVEAHGTFATAHCCRCNTKVHIGVLKAQIAKNPLKVPKCRACKTGLVKPDIVFFGESLPDRFFDKVKTDFGGSPSEGAGSERAGEAGDLLLVLGTSLAVQPFAGLIAEVPPTVPRVLINREPVGQGQPGGFLFGSPDNYRDVLCLGDCDGQVEVLAELLGWREELVEKQGSYSPAEVLSDEEEPPPGESKMSLELLIFRLAEKKKQQKEMQEQTKGSGNGPTQDS